VAVSARSEPVVSHGLVVDVVTMLRWPGSQITVLVDEPVVDLETTAAAGHRIHGTLTAESISDSLSITGTLALDWLGECRRCLGDAQGTVDVDIREIYERTPVEGETFLLTDDRLDLGPMINELSLLTLPLAPLCGDDCLGPAPDDFPATIEAERSGEDEQPSGDPRWAALDAIVFDEAPE
jgi:uncharacterized protein